MVLTAVIKQKSTSDISEMITCFIFSKRDYILVIVIDEPGEHAGLSCPHTDFTVLPLSSSMILLQRHQASVKQKENQNPKICTKQSRKLFMNIL